MSELIIVAVGAVSCCTAAAQPDVVDPRPTIHRTRSRPLNLLAPIDVVRCHIYSSLE
jgi:hypothetical protein